ncbi:hypothetical protein NUW54_g12794 [Trametes sanguinea]|uniref:Uncharacterized protein n=1 Tax=Trametes sanguinea TaxID=158606 RepID=A0ACC1MTJ0_9APHY|nr:hypothetical protein NUW54_g12794 [Trametes sanguinea]
MTLVRYDEEGNAQPVPVDPAGSKFLPTANEFVDLRTSITNLSPSELILTLNLTLEPSDHVVYQGELLDIPVGRLAKGESHEVETPVAFVACGRFDFAAEVRAVARPRESSLVGHGKMRIAVSES